MSFGSFGEGFGAYGSSESNHITVLEDLNPYAVYGAQDWLNTGEPIVQVRGADDTYQDMTESELYGQVYSDFVTAHGTTKFYKIYNQVPGADSESHLIQPTVSLQSSRSNFSTKAIYLGSAYSDNLYGVAGAPDFDGDLTFATRYSLGSTFTMNYVKPAITYYDGVNAGFGWNYVPVHGGAHRQLSVKKDATGTSTGYSRSYADDYGSSQKFATAFRQPPSVGNFSAISVHSSATNRSVTMQPVDDQFATSYDETDNNTDDAGTFGSPLTVRLGIGGWNMGGAGQKVPPGAMELGISCVFDRALNSEEQSLLLQELNLMVNV